MSELHPNLKFHILINETNELNEEILSIVNDYENGEWRYSKFQNFIWDNIAETALSYKERISLIDNSFTKLVDAAKKLRFTEADGKTNGGEIAEIILYGIMKNYYSALPVVPKIFYKQNRQDYAKGADSVHIVVDNDNEFTLWYGEAKFYNSIEDARYNDVFESINNLLLTDKLKKENSIITSIQDLNLHLKDNEETLANILKYLSSENSIDNIKAILHVPILLLYECNITKKATVFTDNFKAEIIEFHKERALSYFTNQKTKIGDKIHKYDEINFHLILFPVPEKETIVTQFIENVKHLQSQ